MLCEGVGISQPDASACYAWLMNVVEAKNPIYNALAQSALSVVRTQATQDELKRGEELLAKIKKETPEKGKSSKNSSFSLF